MPRPACCEVVVVEAIRPHCSHCLHRRPCPSTATCHVRSSPLLRALARERLSTIGASRVAQDPPLPSPQEAPQWLWTDAMPAHDCAIWQYAYQSLVSCGRSAMACTCEMICQVYIELTRVSKFQLNIDYSMTNESTTAFVWNLRGSNSNHNSIPQPPTQPLWHRSTECFNPQVILQLFLLAQREGSLTSCHRPSESHRLQRRSRVTTAGLECVHRPCYC